MWDAQSVAGVVDLNSFGLPLKRVGAGLLIRNRHGRVLVVDPTYKDAWEIPGGMVEVDESPSRLQLGRLRRSSFAASRSGICWSSPIPRVAGRRSMGSCSCSTERGRRGKLSGALRARDRLFNVEPDEEVLQGGVANAGAVVRIGSDVLRPSNEHSASILEFLSELAARGFVGAPLPVRLDDDGRERLRFIPGDVAIPPYPEWVQTDDSLTSTVVLIRDLHDASLGVATDGMTWSSEMADPVGGPVICHNDVCLENVVFRDGHAVALLDFDFAAPGRRTFDLAAFARMCVPVDDDVSSTKLGWHPSNRPGRLRLVCDAYGLDAAGRSEVLGSLDTSIARGGEFVRRRAEAGDPGFVQMWAEIGGMERFDRHRQWWAKERASFSAALG